MQSHINPWPYIGPCSVYPGCKIFTFVTKRMLLLKGYFDSMLFRMQEDLIFVFIIIIITIPYIIILYFITLYYTVLYYQLVNLACVCPTKVLLIVKWSYKTKTIIIAYSMSSDTQLHEPVLICYSIWTAITWVSPALMMHLNINKVSLSLSKCLNS